MCITFMPGSERYQKRVSNSLAMELQMVLSCHVDTGN